MHERCEMHSFVERKEERLLPLCVRDDDRRRSCFCFVCGVVIKEFTFFFLNLFLCANGHCEVGCIFDL